MFALVPLALSACFVALGIHHEAVFLLWVATFFWAVAFLFWRLEIRSRNDDPAVNHLLDEESL